VNKAVIGGILGGLAIIGIIAFLINNEQPSSSVALESPPPTISSESSSFTEQTSGNEVKVIQEPGKIVYWILPGPTKLNEQVFGTPDHPMQTGELKTQQAEGAVKDLFVKFPIMAGVPMQMRETNEDNTEFTVTKKPTPVSNNARIVDGEFEITYKDLQPYDLPGDPTETLDDVDATVKFTDPQGNQYEIEVTKMYQPPFPGFESGGGVMTDTFIHGETGTDSPLFPKIFSYGAFWGIGNIKVNGEITDTDKWVHFMTTQSVRDKNYDFVTSEGLPLMPEDTFSGQVHQTHVIVRPIKITSEGPVFDPVKTAFTLPNGQNQPFIHIMFEQETIIQDSFKDWSPETIQVTKNIETIPDAIVIEGTEFSLTPNEITVKKGEETTIMFKNVGSVAHSFVSDELGIKIDPIVPGDATKITFTPEDTGSFSYWCGVGGHRNAGMEGVIIVK